MNPSAVVFSASKAFVILIAGCLAFSQLSCTKEGPAGPQGAPGSTGTPDDLTNPSIMPAAIFTSPGNNTTGPFNLYTPAEATTKPHFVIRFNKYMLKSSVSSRSIRCEGFDRPVVVRLFIPYRWMGPTRSLGVNSEFYDNILEFTIEDSSYSGRMPYRVGRTYTVVIDTLMEDINGNHPVSQHRFSFMPEPYFRVVDMYPKNGATDVGQSLNTSITFNTLVDGSIVQSIQFSPSTVGQWSIYRYDSTGVVFQAAAALPFNTACTMTVLPTALDRYGNRINTSYSSSFSITPFHVRNTDPSHGARMVSLWGGVSVYLTAQVDSGTVRQSFSISPTVAGIFNSTYWGSVEFRPLSDFVPLTTYTVTLSTALHAHDGTPLPAPYTFSFRTAPFNVDYASPNYGSINVDRNSNVSIYCNSLLDTSSVRASFSIAPFVNVRFDINEGSRLISVWPTTSFGANTRYTITISTALRSKSGVNLSSPYTLIFTTGR